MKFIVTIDRDEDGMWIAECPSIPGCVSQGTTREEAVQNIKEAVDLCLEVQSEKEVKLASRIDQLSAQLNGITQEFGLPKNFLVNLSERHGVARPTWLASQSERTPEKRAHMTRSSNVSGIKGT